MGKYGNGAMIHPHLGSERLVKNDLADKMGGLVGVNQRWGVTVVRIYQVT